MSRKWNPFSKKKGGKVDSHGTTAANEEIQFQPAMRLGEDPHWRGNSLCPNSRARDSVPNALAQDLGRVLNLQNNSANILPSQLHTNIDDLNGGYMFDPALNSYTETDSVDRGHNKQLSQFVKGNNQTTFDIYPLVPVASIPRTSPRVTKKLIKPGATNTPQPAFLTPPTNSNPSVSVSDEYTDPFDAVPTLTKEKSAADGYVEPYQAQQMYRDVTHAATPSNGEVVVENSEKTLYDDPWDNKETKPAHLPENHGDYEEPWDNTETLPYNQPQDEVMLPKSKAHGEMVLEYPAAGALNESGNSSTSSSSASLAKQRMVRVDSPRHSPHVSPHDSPNVDKRLIRPKDVVQSNNNVDPRLQLYSVPGGGPKYKPVDHRLIKAELSLEEKRNSPVDGRTCSSRGSSITNSPMSSNRGSPNRSPLNTLVVGEAISRLMNEPRRSSSPLVQPVNVSHYLLSKAKSRSLDIRNRQGFSNLRGKSGNPIPKSASDHQLGRGEGLHMAAYRGSQPLGGVMEYEEPWDTNNGHHGSKMKHGIPHIAHSRSKSYELGSSNMFVRHTKSHSFDKVELNPPRPMEYERPWEEHESVPQTHIESMQRFQHRQLELHPAEAINLRDFDPLSPLEKQSWFHGRITRDEANRRLDGELEGSYLVRNSESIRNNYSLSLRTIDDTIHMVISRTRDGFWILGEFSAPFHSIPEMIAFYARHRLKINDVQQISLRYPLPEDYL